MAATKGPSSKRRSALPADCLDLRDVSLHQRRRPRTSSIPVMFSAARLRAPLSLRRQLTTASRPTLSLACDSYAPAKPARSGPVVILHGLYGSKQNWRSLAKAMANRLERDVHALVRCGWALLAGGARS